MAEVPGVPLSERGAPTEVFGELTIERRVLLTNTRTIAIGNIASLSVGSFTSRRSSPLLYSALGSAAFALNNFTNTGFSFGGSIAALEGIVVGFFALVLFVAWFFSRQVTETYLIVTTNDGTRSLFAGQSRETLENVRRILSDKINAHDEAATYTINFASGVIENLTLAEGANFQAGALVQGSNNQVVANSPGGRAATAEQTFSATHSPGAQVGFGNAQRDTAVTVTHIDYSYVLPQIEHMHRFYAQDPNARHVADRLSELELLLRSGTPTAEGRSRARALVVDLSTILQAYPQMVQFFQGIMQMIGG